jgi:hypothetical protein
LEQEHGVIAGMQRKGAKISTSNLEEPQEIDSDARTAALAPSQRFLQISDWIAIIVILAMVVAIALLLVIPWIPQFSRETTQRNLYLPLENGQALTLLGYPYLYTLLYLLLTGRAATINFVTDEDTAQEPS